MKKELALVSLLLLTLSGISQALTNISGPIEIEGLSINSGDTIVVYEPQNFQETYESIYTNQKLTTKRSRYTEVDDKKYDYSLRLYIIKKIKKAPDETIILSDGGIFPNYIDIKTALGNSEIITVEGLNERHKKRNLLSDSVAFLHFIQRFEGETNEFWEDYLYTYQNDLYDQTHEDEFEFYGLVNKTGEFLLEAAQKLDNTEVYSANVQVELDDYDFSSGSFKFLWGGSTVRLFKSSIFCKCSIDEIKVEFTNLPHFNSLPVEFEKAKSFISNRKDRRGNVDRKVYLWVNLLLTKDLEFESDDATLKGTIQSIDVYADKNHINGYLGTLN